MTAAEEEELSTRLLSDGFHGVWGMHDGAQAEGQYRSDRPKCAARLGITDLFSEHLSEHSAAMADRQATR
jgi:hypothetical protein